MAIITAADYASITNTTLTPAQTANVNVLIPMVQNSMELYCDRLFDAQDYSEWLEYSKYVTLSAYPVTQMKYIGYLSKCAAFDLTTYTYEITPTALYVTDSNLTTTTVTFGGAIAVLTDIKTAIEALIPTLTLTIDSGMGNISYKLLKVGTGKQIYYAARSDVQTILRDNRSLEFYLDAYFIYAWPTDFITDTQLYVVYTAGYTSATMPKALQRICANCIKDITNAQTANVSGLYSHEQITNYAYTLADNVAENVGQELKKYYGDLDPFVRHVI